MADSLTEGRDNRKFCEMFIQTTGTRALTLKNPAVLKNLLFLCNTKIYRPQVTCSLYDEHGNYIYLNSHSHMSGYIKG
jgi:hypothetical protein